MAPTVCIWLSCIKCGQFEWTNKNRMSDHCAFCDAKEEDILGTWCGACWKPVCSVKCAAHARIHGLSVVRNVAELKKIMHGCMQSGCTGRAGWKCDGCNKRLCPEHQIIQNHDCTVCHYCGNSANGMCDGCDRYSCSFRDRLSNI